MNDQEPNLFNALFKFRPRDGRNERENFLTEAFAYLLMKNPSLANEWLAKIVGVGDRPNCVDITEPIRTRESFEVGGDGKRQQPDVVIRGTVLTESVVVFEEHKWDSPCNPDQLRRYAEALKNERGRKVLAFVCLTSKQKNEARKCKEKLPQGIIFCIYLWMDVFGFLSEHVGKEQLMEEFMTFMKDNGLSPMKPLCIDTMQAFVKSLDFVKQLDWYAARLMGREWKNLVPEPFLTDPRVKDRWGRTAIEFLRGDQANPRIAMGFLYDPRLHKVKLQDPKRGIDLFLRIAANSENHDEKEELLLECFKKRRNALREMLPHAEVRLCGDEDNGNPFTLLIAQRCLADVIGNSPTSKPEDQIDTIYDCLKTWCEAMFGGDEIRTLIEALPVSEPE